MNYLYIYKDRETGKISRIDTLYSISLRNKYTLEEVNAEVDKYNANTEYSRKIEILEIDNDSIYETFKFLLGEDEYVTTKTINTIHNDCEELHDTLEGIESDISHMRYRIENLVEHIKEQFKIED